MKQLFKCASALLFSACMLLPNFVSAQTYCTPTVTPTAISYYLKTLSTTGGITNINYSTTTATLYVDSSAVVLSQIAGGSITATFTASSTNSSLRFYCFVDWENDGDFTTAGDTAFYAVAASPATITVPAGQAAGSYRIRFAVNAGGTMPSPCTPTVNTIGANILVSGNIVDFTLNVVALSNCSGTPDAGTASVSTAEDAAGNNYTVSAAGYSFGNGYTYQWQSNIGGAGWTNTGSSTSAYSGLTQTAGAFGTVSEYRLIVTCTNSNEKDTTNTVIFTGGYCNPIAGTSSTVYWIDSIITSNGINNIEYSQITAFQPYVNNTAIPFSQAQGDSINIFISSSNTSNSRYYCFTDWNNNGVFTDAGDTVFATTSTTSQYTGVIPIASTQPVGSYRVRFANSGVGAIGPCAANYGSFVDYTLTVIPPVPTITNFTPDNGCANVGTVTVSGTNLTNVTAVTIGGTPVNSFTIDNDNQISAVAGSGTTGEIRVYTATDSAVSATLFTVNAASQTTQNVTLCAGETLTVGTHTYSQAGTFYDTLQAVNTCDSVVITTLAYYSPIAANNNVTFCNGNQSETVGSHTYTDAGTYIDTLISPITGCDSVVTTVITIGTINTALSPLDSAGVQASAEETGASYQWVNCATGTVIAGATNQSYTATATGSYRVVISKNGCTDSSDCVTLTVDSGSVGINEVEWAKAVNIYPNPTSGVATISIAHFTANDLNITISDMQGKVVYATERSITSSNFNTTIDLSGTAKGVYTVKLNTGSDIAVRQLILQ